MRPATVVELAERYGVDLPEGLREGRYEFRDFRHFIDEFVAGIACLRELDDFRRIAYEVAEDEAAEGVRYAEVMVSLPDHRARFDDWDAVLEAVLEGLADGERDFGVVSRVIVDVVRGIALRLSRRAMEVGVRHRDAGVVGIGVGGEERFAPEPYEEIFLAGIGGGLHSVPHAGENEGRRRSEERCGSSAPSGSGTASGSWRTPTSSPRCASAGSRWTCVRPPTS